MPQTFPDNLLPITSFDAGDIQDRNEVQRRQQYIAILEVDIGRYPPALVELVKECLHNSPDQRPTTDDLLARLQRMREEVERKYGGSELNVVREKLVEIKDRRIVELTQIQVLFNFHQNKKLMVGCITRKDLKENRDKTRQLGDLTGQLEDQRRELKDQLKVSGLLYVIGGASAASGATVGSS